MDLVHQLTRVFTQLISETSGLSLDDTLTLAEQQQLQPEVARCIEEFHELLGRFRLNAQPIEALFAHPVSKSLGAFFRAFPIPFRDEHIHLTGSIDAEFIYPRLAPLLESETYSPKIAGGLW